MHFTLYGKLSYFVALRFLGGVKIIFFALKNHSFVETSRNYQDILYNKPAKLNTRKFCCHLLLQVLHTLSPHDHFITTNVTKSQDYEKLNTLIQ